MNPDNKKPSIVYIEDGKEHKYFDESVYERVPNMLRILGG